MPKDNKDRTFIDNQRFIDWQGASRSRMRDERMKRLTHNSNCPDCGGKGEVPFEDEFHVIQCKTCEGTGHKKVEGRIERHFLYYSKMWLKNWLAKMPKPFEPLLSVTYEKLQILLDANWNKLKLSGTTLQMGFCIGLAFNLTSVLPPILEMVREEIQADVKVCPQCNKWTLHKKPVLSGGDNKLTQCYECGMSWEYVSD